MKNLSNKNVLEIRMDCLFTYEGNRMLLVNEPWGSTASAPLLFAGRTVQGEILYRFGKHADDNFIEKAESLLSRGIWDASLYMRELNSTHFSEESCFYFKSPIHNDFDVNCRQLTAADSNLLQSSFGECLEELATAQPYVGYFSDDQIVSICRSVRKGRGHEAGIETLPKYRRRGFGESVLKEWISEVQKKGIVPLYSASKDNVASLKLATKVGFHKYADAIEIW